MTNELKIEAFKLLDEMASEKGVYPSSTLLNQYEYILMKLKNNPSDNLYQATLEIMVKIYYMRDSEKCLFANILMDHTYHCLKD